MWQDVVITITNIVFSLSLFPQVYFGFKERKGHITIATSAPTFIGLYVVAIAFLSLHLFFSALTAGITGTLWLILFLQRLKFGKSV